MMTVKPEPHGAAVRPTRPSLPANRPVGFLTAAEVDAIVDETRAWIEAHREWDSKRVRDAESASEVQLAREAEATARTEMVAAPAPLVERALVNAPSTANPISASAPESEAAQRLGFRTPGDQAWFLCKRLGFDDGEVGQMLAAAVSGRQDTPWARGYKMCAGLVAERMEATESYIGRGARTQYHDAIAGEEWDIAATILERELGSAARPVVESINRVYAGQESAMLTIMMSKD